MNLHRIAESVRFAALAVVLASAATAASAAEKNLNTAFTVKPGGVLTVDADGADISVVGGEANTVTVRITARGTQAELDDLTLSAEPSEDGIKVSAKRP